MRYVLAALAAAATLLTVGCVLTTRHTIDAHIVVDVRYVEEYADDALDYIEGKSEELPSLAEGAQKQSVWQGLRSFFASPVAYAAETELKVESARARQLLQRMRERHPKVEALKRKEAVGESNEGYVVLRNPEELEDAEAVEDAKAVIEEENDDRKAYYREVARLSKATLAEVQRIFAQRRLDRADKGAIFQLPPPGQDFEEFKDSSAGERLGDDCRPNAWVTIK
jgi:uncharacterized protein YdbL (DUF1318 family)